VARKQTPSQTVGPFFAFALTGPQYGYHYDALGSGALAGKDAPGEHIRVVGRVLDGAGAPVDDAMIEIWQADSQGRYAHPADGRPSNQPFKGFGRCGTGTDPENRFVFDTIKPGSVDDTQAPHINVLVFMRGLLSHAYTRIYFSDETQANERDPVLSNVPAELRQTLIAEREQADGAVAYRFDIVMQGERETVFFDI
jgi:protocatechuate 3,4-dioxygenase alpha subunit